MSSTNDKVNPKNEQVVDMTLDSDEDIKNNNGKINNNNNDKNSFTKNSHNNNLDNNNNKYMDIDENNESEDDENEDDPVIKRFDVYLSQQLTDNLCVFQYPLRPPWQPYNFEAMKQFKIRPKHKRVNMTFGVNTSDEHYDPDFYMNSNLPKPQSEEETFNLNSTHVPSKTNYAVAILRGDQLHLTPVQTVLQMRPDFSHMDKDKTTSSGEQVVGKVDPKEKKSKSGGRGASSSGSSSTGSSGSQSKAAAGASAGRASGLRVVSSKRKTFADLKREEAKDEWKECDFHPDTSPESSVVREQLFHNSFGEVHFDVNSEDFLQHLVPYQSQIRSTGLSMDLLQHLKSHQQVNAIMIAAKTLKYSRIKELVTKASSDEQLLSLLEEFAYLVDGRWVVKGDVFFRKSPRLAAAHEYLLYLFHKRKPVYREPFTRETSITSEQSYKLFSGIAELDDETRLWRLQGEPDHEFEEEFPDIVQREIDRWNGERWSFINRNLEDNMQSLPMRIEPSERGSSATGPTKTRRAPSRITRAQPPQTQAKKFLQQMFSTYGVCNMALLRKELQNYKMAKNSSLDLSSVTETIFQDTLETIGLQIGGDKWVMREFGDEKLDTLRHIAVRFFQTKERVAGKEIINAWEKEAPHITITPAIYSSVMSELSTKTGSYWRLRTGNAQNS